MNLRFTEMLCPNCGTQTMGGAGGSVGGRITTAKMRCSKCALTLLIIPMDSRYQYELSATTAEERAEQRIARAKESHTLKLAEEITGIRKSLQS